MNRIMAASSQPLLVTVPNVPMISTGIEYPLASGPQTFTEDDLIDAVAAFDDPAVHLPRTKIGHVDPRFNMMVQPDGTVLDGEPSLGTWSNIRLSEDNQTIFGDIIGVPRWLAEIMGTAYPSRSIEGNMDVETVTGHHWRLVIDAVALLGVVGPGVTTLDDLPILFSEDGPEVEVIEAKEGEPMSVQVPAAVAAARGSQTQPQAISGSVNIDDIRRAYYDQLDAGQMWWWVRAMYMDPLELIVDDDEGGLYRVPFAVNGDTVTFEDPQEVKIEYVDKPKTNASAALRAALTNALRPQDKIAASYDSRADARPETQEEETTGMTPEQLRQSLGLPDDATDDQVQARIAELREAAEEPEETPEETPEGEGEPETPETPAAPAEGEAQPAGTAASVTVPDGMRLVDEAAWEQVQAGAKAGSDLAKAEAEKSKKAKISAAVKAGKFPPERMEHYEQAWDRDPEGTEALINLLPDNSVPVSARGVTPTNEQALNGDDPGYNREWLSQSERNRLAAAQAGQTPVVTTGGD